MIKAEIDRLKVRVGEDDQGGTSEDGRTSVIRMNHADPDNSEDFPIPLSPYPLRWWGRK